MEEEINRLINEGKTYTFRTNCYSVPHGTFSRPSIEMQAWIAEVENYIIENYTEESAPYKVFSRFDRHKLDGNYESQFEEEKNIILSALTSCLRIKPKEATAAKTNSLTELDYQKVFVVHGHDEETKERIARFISKLSFEPIILHEQASSGKTIIEKIENYSNVGFAVVLYTPCDVGGKNVESPTLLSRARQNVVFEHGYLIGKIGRRNVCAIVRGNIETPNDISGVVYINLDENNAWQIALAKEMKHSGYDIDFNKIL